VKILILGYGNPGRQDDGLGPALAAAIEAMELPGVSVDADYQLVVEDAAAVAEHEVVIFADAHLSLETSFKFQAIQAVEEISFSSHSARPEAILGLAQRLFGAQTQGYLLSIQGEAFEPFVETMTACAEHNLEQAVRFLHHLITEGFKPTEGEMRHERWQAHHSLH